MKENYNLRNGTDEILGETSLDNDIIDDLFVHVLMTSNVSEKDIVDYLKNHGLTEKEINRLFADQIIYSANIDDYDELTKDLVLKSLRDRNYSLTTRLIDIINKRDGRYSQQVDIRSNNDPIKIQFTS